MFEFISGPINQGILFFLLMTSVLLGVIRLTRTYPAIRSRIKVPLVAIFILLSGLNLFFMFGYEMPPVFEHYYKALLYLMIAVLIIRITILISFAFLERSKQYRIPRLVEEITKGILYGIAVIAIIQYTLNIKVTTVLATSAIITVVIGLALQETLGNLFAGLALQLDPAYQVGDWIRVGQLNGKVEEITWRATKLRTLNNDSITIPNGIIAKETLVNQSYPATPHATRLSIRASYSSPPNKVDRAIREVLERTANVSMDPPPDVRVSSFQDFSVEYEVKFYYKDAGLLEPMIAQVRKGLWYNFRRNGIEIPFPIRNVYLHDRIEAQEQQQTLLARLTQSLKRIYLFAQSSDEDLKLIAENLEEMRYASGEYIIREGEVGDSFFIIDRGEVEIFVTSVSGTKKPLTTLHDGDFFGEIALLTGERRSASVQAVTDVRVFELKKDGFKSVLERKPELLDEIGSILSRRKDQLVTLLAESSSPGESLSMNTEQAKHRILGRIRSYFGI